jgi:RNA polymerase sigma-70 factor (ECF subfamily)
MAADSVVSEPLAPKLRPHLRAIPGGSARTSAAAVATYSDEQLFEGIARGDERISAEVYRRLLPTVEATLFRVLGRREPEHEDFVQSSFEQIILTLSERRYAQACSLKTWASTISAHVALKVLRSRYRQRKVFNTAVEPAELTERTSGNEDVERTVALQRELELLRGLLTEISVDQAEAVLLHDLMGHALAEIATITGVSIAAAQSRLVRGRKELQTRLAKASSTRGGS